MIHKCWWERFQNVKTTKTDAAGWFCIKVFGTPWRGATTAAGPITSNNNRFCPMFFGPRESRPSSHHTRLLPCFFSRPDLSFGQRTSLFLLGSPQTSRMFGCFDLYKAMASSVSLKEWIAKDAKVKSPKSVVVSLFTSNFNPSPFFIGSAIAINLPRASHKRKPPWEPDGSARSKAWRIWSRRTKAPGEDLENQELWASSHSWEDGSLVWIFSNKILVISCIWSYPQRWAPHLNIQMLPPTIFCVAVHNVVTTEGQIIYKTIGK